jgi:hypothetical protein
MPQASNPRPVARCRLVKVESANYSAPESPEEEQPERARQGCEGDGSSATSSTLHG